MNSYTLFSLSSPKNSRNSQVHSQTVRLLGFTALYSSGGPAFPRSNPSLKNHSQSMSNKHKCRFEPLHKQHALFPFFFSWQQVHISRDYRAISAYIWLTFKSSEPLRVTRNSDDLQFAGNASGHDGRLCTTVTDALWHPCVNNVIRRCWKRHYG